MTRPSLVRSMVRGAIAGAIATGVMDWVTTGLQQQQSEEDAAREAAARPGGQSSVSNLVDLVAGRLGLTLDAQTRSLTEQVVHFALGAVPGAVYAVLRRRLPLLGAGRGLVFGGLLFIALDEYAGTALGISGSPDAYPASTHLRGLIGHAVLGVATDTLVDVTGG